MGRRATLVIGLLAGCGFEARPGFGHDAAAPIDSHFQQPTDSEVEADAAPPDSSIPVANTVCYGTFAKVCITTTFTSTLNITGGSTLNINTDDLAMCIATVAGTTVNNNPCVIGGTTVTIDGKLTATGSRPLVIVSDAGITINGAGVIDVSSRAGVRGAGASNSCGGGNGPLLGGGGAGGTYQLAGGNGGNGGGGTGGIASPAIQLGSGRGGCPGQHGGFGTGGSGGYGGGYVQLIGTSITDNGTISSNGAGGQGANLVNSGGGGGGSGGAIILDTPTLNTNGSTRFVAQGGSGAEGSSLAATGNDGTNATTPGTAAVGGDGHSAGGGGGDGGVTNAGLPAGSGGNGSGGGGGGGGPGFVHTSQPEFTNSGMSFPPFS